jgi:hypothetical protein
MTSLTPVYPYPEFETGRWYKIMRGGYGLPTRVEGKPDVVGKYRGIEVLPGRLQSTPEHVYGPLFFPKADHTFSDAPTGMIGIPLIQPPLLKVEPLEDMPAFWGGSRKRKSRRSRRSKKGTRK